MFRKLNSDLRLFRELDFTIVIISIIISIFGALNIYLASGISDVIKQLSWFIISLCAAYFLILIDYNLIKKAIPIFYWATVASLIFTRYFGVIVNGARRWIRIGPLSIQPAEFAKLAIILILAKKLDEMEGNVNDIKNFLILAIYAGIPMLIIVLQPNMGLTMICFFIVLGMFFVSGLDIKVIVGSFMSIITFIALIWNSPLMQPHWKKRLLSFVNPSADELGIGLQLKQSMIGIGSGGVYGIGLKTGSYVSEFVPESQTDFIYVVIAEHWGFIGGVFLLLLYGILIYRVINIGKSSKDIFGSMICIGFVSTWIFSILQNIGMTIGVMPISGITLPFISYGGSAVLASYMALAIVLNVGMRRKKINF
ncbi:rod shape-determining protein RodA [Clostridium frigidicarnis]|uniref:Cell elongation-specific peptidoglycan biosynthesis regulator RodA n=1 Tax=Clostridium frigidicarnis TaxID=84698 RepID=A0A1I0YU30_9CLOT|nr:rod shape-determining protein RodA [Clostridium frigidicarnis]SFB16346.1 cell elongation-specific peptidoglycan biosynthesis regulator RodA [Clostridium frigidicarnis]